MTKSQREILIIVLSLFAVGLGVKAMLDVPTLFLASWFLVLFYFPFLFGLSYGVGLFVKAFLKFDLSKWAYTSIIAAIISLSFYFSQQKATCEIIVPANFTGEVRLFLSNESANDFNVNRDGIGYISKRTFTKGFKPRVIKNGKDITKDVQDLGRGRIGGMGYELDFISFNVPGASNKNDLLKAIDLQGVDTPRVLHRN